MPGETKSLPLTDSELNDYILSNSHFLDDGMITYTDMEEVCMPSNYKDIEEEIMNFEVRPDDVWVISFPKCGSTWTQEMVWLLMNELDYEGAKKPIFARSPFIEFGGLGTIMQNVGRSLDYLEDLKNAESPRVIKTHLPAGLIPQQIFTVKPKSAQFITNEVNKLGLLLDFRIPLVFAIIYVMRHPIDVAVSWLNHNQVICGYKGTPEKFYEAFMSSIIMFGSYFGNVASYSKLFHEPNVLINTFEDMKKDLPAVIRRTADFLDKSVTDDQLEELNNHLSFSSMKDNEYANLSDITTVLKKIHGTAEDQEFINKGEVEIYKTSLSPEWIATFEQWVQENKEKYNLLDVDFPY